VGTSINNPGSVIHGIESQFVSGFARYFHLSVNATWQDTSNKSDNPALDGKQLPGRYEKSLFVRLDADITRLNLYAEYLREDNMYYDSTNLLKADDKQSVTLGGKYLYRALQLRLEVKNIFNNRFNDYYRQAQASGTAYFGSVKLEF
jgi:iron complex outermembrane receptor protein